MSDLFHYAVSGTESGITIAQLRAAEEEFIAMPPDAVQHNGLCVGADFQLGEFARKFGHTIIGHPGVTKRGNLYKRSTLVPDELLPEKQFLDRNKDIVVEGKELLIATPGEEEEILRSGTWSTIRRAREIGRRTIIYTPTGRRL